jgi:hypothetical protein
MMSALSGFSLVVIIGHNKIASFLKVSNSSGIMMV